jgi:hypothetical protein
MMATAVLDEDRSVAAVAGQYRCGWHTVHDEVVAVAEDALGAEPAPVAVLGIDETRRGIGGGRPRRWRLGRWCSTRRTAGYLDGSRRPELCVRIGAGARRQWSGHIKASAATGTAHRWARHESASVPGALTG